MLVAGSHTRQLQRCRRVILSSNSRYGYYSRPGRFRQFNVVGEAGKPSNAYN